MLVVVRMMLLGVYVLVRVGLLREWPVQRRTTGRLSHLSNTDPGKPESNEQQFASTEPSATP